MRLTMAILGTLCLAAPLGQGPFAQSDPINDRKASAASRLGAYGKNSPGAAKVLSLRTIPAVIDEPGFYVLNRDWDDTSMTEPPGGSQYLVLHVIANDVSLDMRGFTISSDREGTLLRIDGTAVAVRNGRLLAGDSQVESFGAATELESMEIRARNGLGLHGPRSLIKSSRISNRFGVSLNENSVIESSRLACFYDCLSLGASNQVLGSRVDVNDGAAITVHGDGNVVSSNILRQGGGFPLMTVEGDQNVLSQNTWLAEGDPRPALVAVHGTGNTIDGNIAPPTRSDLGPPGGVTPVGIAFTCDGNYYGDNRIAALVPFELGGTVQTDWGGNVGY